MKRLTGALLGMAALVVFAVLFTGTAAAIPGGLFGDDEETIAPSGSIDFKDVTFGNLLTECPQAGLGDKNPKPLDRRARDAVEQRSNAGNDIRVNQDYSCFPQDETSIDQNPVVSRNIVGGANDYRLGWATSGFYSSTDSGQTWYDGLIPFPSLPSGDNLDGGGDPSVVFDRNGTVYYADLNFNRTDDTSGVWVSRSTNGGFTWSRPCVAIRTAPAPSEQGVCGGAGDPRQPGDGTVSFIQDNNSRLDGSVPGNDKEWITAGPRPTGVAPTCFTPFARAPRACDPAVVGPDRLYVTWSIFAAVGTGAGNAQIFFSYSDDQARSWSAPKPIYGAGQFCLTPDSSCRDSQGSQPTVNPTTGELWVGFLNGDTADEDQYLVVHSTDGGQTFSPPSRVDTLYDVNEPRGVNGRTDCVARGQGSTRTDLTNTCFRADPIMNSIVADKRGGAFADDLYVVIYDNRNGTIRDSNNDVFFYKSTDGGTTWIGPTRVNNDRSQTPANRDCGRNVESIVGDSSRCPELNTGADQFFPWVTIDVSGNLNVTFHDRRLDQTKAPNGAWPTSRTEDGNYLVWFWGAQCRITQTQTVSQTTTGPVPSGASQCVAPEAVVNPTVATGFNPGAGPVPGNGQNPATLPFRNFQISDVPSNWDYSFRAGIFAGDYTGNASGPVNPAGNGRGDQGNNDSKALAFWTDARNGRGSGAPTSFQPGRNPICEQSDVFFQSYSAAFGRSNNGHVDTAEQEAFLVTPCPGSMQDRRDGHDNNNNDKH